MDGPQRPIGQIQGVVDFLDMATHTAHLIALNECSNGVKQLRVHYERDDHVLYKFSEFMLSRIEH